MMRTVLVTGSSSGFGRVTVETLARAGDSVFAAMRDITGRNRGPADELRGLAAHEHLAIHVVEMDIADDASVEAAVRKVLDEVGHLDVIVNNAGIFASGYLESFTPEDLAKVFDLNVLGAMRVNRAVLPHMRARRGGLLVHISSVAGRTPFPFSVPYAASKAALEFLAEGYRYELSALGIDVAIIQPGTYPTPLFEKTLHREDPRRQAGYEEVAETKDRLLDGLQRVTQDPKAPDPLEVAEAILRVLDMPPGRRPLRTVIDRNDQGVTKINHVAETTQAKLFHELGIDDLLSIS